MDVYQEKIEHTQFKEELKRIKKLILAKPLPTLFIQEQTNPKENAICICQDSKGEFKTLYPTQTKASQQAKLLFETKGIKLKIYPCPDTLGWHLSTL
ncbi:MAG: hypothetical protein JXQ76_05040 [Campylobacterales bacterium]|nr:hypothetical protein [Campylobacterales bacterium]